MGTFKQTYQGATIEVTCEGSQCTVRRIENGQSNPTWTNGLSVASIAGGRGSNFYANPVFDLAEGFVSLHVTAVGATGHEPWEESWATISLVDGSVLSYRNEGG
jgi:hypothetical protein